MVEFAHSVGSLSCSRIRPVHERDHIDAVERTTEGAGSPALIEHIAMHADEVALAIIPHFHARRKHDAAAA